MRHEGIPCGVEPGTGGISEGWGGVRGDGGGGCLEGWGGSTPRRIDPG